MNERGRSDSNDDEVPRFQVAECATLACLLEVVAPKVGNVHRGADFEDLTLSDFAVSAAVIGPVLARAAEQGVGRTVYEAVAATQQWVGRNTNLGIALLLAPLAACPREVSIRIALPEQLQRLTPSDADWTYRAIRLADPGGLGEADEMDVREPPPADLLAAMRAAADRDLIARQYAEDFRLVLDEAAPAILAARDRGLAISEAVVEAQMELLSRHPDSLIERKCGAETAGAAQARARAAIDARENRDSATYAALVEELDFWMRSDGHRRNPGAIADLLAAALFVLLREGQLNPPLR